MFCSYCSPGSSEVVPVLAVAPVLARGTGPETTCPVRLQFPIVPVLSRGGRRYIFLVYAAQSPAAIVTSEQLVRFSGPPTANRIDAEWRVVMRFPALEDRVHHFPGSLDAVAAGEERSVPSQRFKQ